MRKAQDQHATSQRASCLLNPPPATRNFLLTFPPFLLYLSLSARKVRLGRLACGPNERL